MNFRYLFLLLSFLVCGGGFVSAQQPAFRNFQVKDGMPGSEVYDAYQDSKGYMWFSTDKGVSRYDGHSFRNFSLENGLADNTIFSAREDKHGRIWFRSLSGKLSYFLHDTIYALGANSAITRFMQNAIMTGLYFDTADTIWCGLSGGSGYLKIAPPYRAGDCSYCTIPGNVGYILRFGHEGYIWGMVVDYKRNGIFPATNKEKGLWIINYGKGIDSVPGPGIMNTNSFLCGNGNDKYIYCTPKEIVFYEGRQMTSWIPPATPIMAHPDSRGRIWISYFKEGVSLINPGNREDKTGTAYLNGFSVTSFFEDREGGVWLTTLENGVYYMASEKFVYYDMSNGLRSNKVTALLPWDSTHLLVGNTLGSIDLVTPQGVRELGTANTPPSSGFIYLLNKTSTSQLLVGTTRSYFYPVNGSLETPDPAKYRDNHPEMIIPAPFVVKCAATRPDGHFWVGNYLYLSEVDPQNKKIISQCKPPSRILSMICTDNKTVWLGCLNGLWKYQNGVFTYLGDSLPIFQTRIEDMKLNKDGTWWFATRGKGLILKKGKQIFNLSERNGLSSNVCSSIYIDSEGIIWVATNKGIDRIISEAWGSYQIRSYSMEDGLVSNEINQVVRMGNDIWAGSNQGLIRFPALVDNAYGSPPPVYITGLSVNSVEYALKDSLNFKHNQNFLQISFLGLSYRGRIPVNYKYRLEGLEDTAWAYTSGMSIQYTNLPPGNYTFKTYAINSHGQISPNPASLSFSIAKPFWAETWFRLLAALFISGLILSIFMLRLRTLKRKILEKAVINQRITEMELKALRAQMNPHFIFNCISSIQYYVLANDAESADRYLSKFSKLIRNVLTNSKQERISLETELQTLELYIQLESMRFSSKFSYRIEIDSDLQTGCVSIPPLILQPYVENAIWHGLMHLTERNGELVIRLDKKETEVHCIIEDNGIGRKKNQELKKNNTHKSFGLTITRERLAFMNKRQLTEEGIKIIDKYNEDGVPEGTRIELLLPLEQLNEDTIL